MSPRLCEPVGIGSRTAPSRAVFGPHVTNLCDRRAIGPRHAAYYERRARGGCGVIVTEVASVHESDWPYERAPLAADCDAGFALVAEACHRHGALCVAGLGHAGMQGSTAYSQDVLWAPSLTPNVATHEQPIAMTRREVDALVAGFADAARGAVRAGLDGVELNAGQHSLLRQFCSGLTNLRTDEYGQDRGLLLAEVLAAVREAVGGAVVGLRWCVDELAPWAGLVPQAAAELAARLAADVDYLAVVRGSIYTEAMTQPDGHEPEGVNLEATALVAAALRASGSRALVCAQGSIVTPSVAEDVLAGGVDLVEMTRAQIADPDLCAKVARGDAARVRPCVLCNQHCLVRDVRNPIVTCTVNPVAGHELVEPDLDVDDAAPRPDAGRDAVVVGGGVAGMEAARLLARRGGSVTLLEREARLGGAVRLAAAVPGRERLAALCDWLERELSFEGVTVRLSTAADATTVASATVRATGSVQAPLALRLGDDGTVAVLDAAAVAAGARPAGGVVVLDPVGGPVGVGVAELLAAGGASVSLVVADLVAGAQLSMSGDLVAANERLARATVRVVRHAQPIGISEGSVVVEDRYTGEVQRLAATAVVDAGHRLPDDAPWPEGPEVVGDALAPRGVMMAMLEARRAAVRARRAP